MTKCDGHGNNSADPVRTGFLKDVVWVCMVTGVKKETLHGAGKVTLGARDSFHRGSRTGKHSEVSSSENRQRSKWQWGLWVGPEHKAIGLLC